MRNALLLAVLVGCTSPESVDLAALIDVDAMIPHLETLEAIADAQDGNRASTTPGYADSVDYLASTLEAAGYTVTRDTYDVVHFSVRSATLDEVTGDTTRALPFEVFEYSGAGTIEAAVTAVDVTVPAPNAENTSTSGCDPSDFTDFPVGDIALIQRGTCPFAVKAANAETAGAAAVIIFNEGQSGRRDVVQGQLRPSSPPNIPVVGVSYSTGAYLVDTAPITARLTVDATVDVQQDTNLVTQTAGGDPNRVIMLGGHLDSVPAGPGINDNGSGSAFLLELALQMAAADYVPTNQVRFAWWGAEEAGLIGSSEYFYVDGDTSTPDDTVVAPLEAYLNFDMIASGNGGRWVYDGDQSDFSEGIDNPGSAVIERLFLDHFDNLGLATAAEGLLVPTDSYWPVLLGVPAGGLFSGATTQKTAEDVALFGGDVGVARDACYHRACDRVDHLDTVLYSELARGAAAVTQALAERAEPLPRPDARRAATSPLREQRPPTAGDWGSHHLPALDR